MSYRIAHWSDLHLDGDDSDEAFLTNLFASLKEYSVDHLIVTGDVTDDGESEGFALLDHMRRKHGYGPRKSTVLPGNHDLPGWEDYMDHFGQGFSPLYRKLTNGLYLVTVDSTKPDKLPNMFANPQGWLDEGDWKGLVRALDEITELGGEAIVALHHHVFDVPDGDNRQRLGRLFNMWGPLEDSEDFLDLMGQYGVNLVLTGHSHEARIRKVRRHGHPIACHIGGSTSDQHAYRVLDFTDGVLTGKGWVHI